DRRGAGPLQGRRPAGQPARPGRAAAAPAEPGLAAQGLPGGLDADHLHRRADDRAEPGGHAADPGGGEPLALAGRRRPPGADAAGRGPGLAYPAWGAMPGRPGPPGPRGKAHAPPGAEAGGRGKAGDAAMTRKLVGCWWTAALVGLLAGCGGSDKAAPGADEEQAREAFTAFQKALEAKDGDKLWSMLDEDAQADVERAAKAAREAYAKADPDE